MARKQQRRRVDVVGIAALVLVLLLLLAGWLLFPHFQHLMAWQDCVASGRTNCGN